MRPIADGGRSDGPRRSCTRPSLLRELGRSGMVRGCDQQSSRRLRWHTHAAVVFTLFSALLRFPPLTCALTHYFFSLLQPEADMAEADAAAAAEEPLPANLLAAARERKWQALDVLLARRSAYGSSPAERPCETVLGCALGGGAPVSTLRLLLDATAEGASAAVSAASPYYKRVILHSVGPETTEEGAFCSLARRFFGHFCAAATCFQLTACDERF